MNHCLGCTGRVGRRGIHGAIDPCVANRNDRDSDAEYKPTTDSTDHSEADLTDQSEARPQEARPVAGRPAADGPRGASQLARLSDTISKNLLRNRCAASLVSYPELGDGCGYKTYRCGYIARLARRAPQRSNRDRAPPSSGAVEADSSSLGGVLASRTWLRHPAQPRSAICSNTRAYFTPHASSEWSFAARCAMCFRLSCGARSSPSSQSAIVWHR